MRPLENRNPVFETEIRFEGVQVKLDEVEVNILDVDTRHEVNFDPGRAQWDWSVSIGTDRGDDCDEPHDTLVCYLNASLLVNGERYGRVKLNTLHTYHVQKLNYKKAHDELFKRIALESVAHANVLLAQAVKATAYEGACIPDYEEDWLSEDASEWNKSGYIPRAAQPDEKAIGRKLSKAEIDALSARADELVAFIDAYDASELPHTEAETREYWMRYAEWASIKKQLWHFKMIARNTLAYTMNKMVVAMGKAAQANPHDYRLQEAYEETKENYLSLMEAWKDEFAKN